MKKIGALWQKKDKNGNTFFSGKIGEKRILIFKNKKKNNDNLLQPDWEISDPDTHIEEFKETKQDIEPNQQNVVEKESDIDPANLPF